MAETAGLVLAAFPAIVQALSSFAKSLETAKSWRYYRRELKSYARMLDCQRTWYSDTLEELFDGIVTTDDELAQLMSHPDGPSWKLHEDQLRFRLGTAYMSYLNTIEELMAALQDFSQRIGIDESGKVDWSTYSAIERQIKRLKITLSKKVYANLLEQINKANKDLREVTHQNRFLEPIRHKRRSKRNAAYFKEIRKNARSLYNVIVKGAAWNCRCKDHHFANLRLEMRHRDLLETKFRVLLTSGMNQPTSSLTSGRNIWTKRELDVEPLIEPDIQSVTDAAGGPPISLSREAEYQKGSLTTRRGVRFAPSLFSAKSSGQEAPILVSHSSATSTYQNSITDLCNAMQCCAPERGIGVIADDSSNKKYHIYVVRQDLLSSCRVSPEPLDRLLMASQNRTLDFYLTRLNRLQIAVTLASSILQLDGTSWLRSRWSSTDILFQHQPPNFDLSQPYLSSRVYADSPGTSAQESSISDINTREHIHGKATNETAYLIHNEILFALGITLIELAFGKPLVDMQRPEDVQSSEILTTIKTTHRLLDQVYNESGGRYGDVVRRCLQCSFDVKDKTFENDEFQEAVFELVVNPLMQDLEAFRA